jgi:hypothetical protein
MYNPETDAAMDRLLRDCFQPVPTSCSSRTAIGTTRDEALANFYSAERRAGADPLTANERMHEFAKRLDAEFERDLSIIKQCVERK